MPAPTAPQGGSARDGGGAGERVVAVLVAHERRALMLQALAAIAAQTVPVAALVLVDNASTDGSSAAARELADERGLPLDLVRLERNTGGAGGFAAGLARAAAAHDPAWVWLMDDDTVPTPGALAELLAAAGRHERLGGGPAARPALLASRAVWHDGRDHPMNTPRPRPGARAAARALAARAGGVPVRSASFVSLLVDAAAVREHGLPVADYFLWNDDFEFTTRLLRDRPGLWVPGSVVEHRTRAFGASDADPGPRFRWEVRNKLWLFTRSTGLRPAEKLLYGASSARRWARALARSRERGVLVAGLRRGAGEALRPPRPTPVVLAGLGDVSDQVAAVERAAGRPVGP